MQQLAIALITGFSTGIAAVIAWALLWTVVIPWEAHDTFYMIVFVGAGFGGAVLSLRGRRA